MNMNFEGKNVLVTGHSRGIGKAIYDMFKHHNANVFGISKKDCDFSDTIATRQYANQFASKHNIDILINCAGINKVGSIQDSNVNMLGRMMSVNVYSPMVISQSVIPNMKKNGYGRIINIGSVFSNRAKKNRLEYVTSKHALLGLTRSMSHDLRKYGILVNMVSPDVTDTDMTRTMMGDNINMPLLSVESVAHRVLTICYSDTFGANWEMTQLKSGKIMTTIS